MYDQAHRVRLIRGYLDHDTECCRATFTRIPVQRVHPSVFKLALEQMKTGATWATIKATNYKKSEPGSLCPYPEMLTSDGKTRYRWTFEKRDSRSLYRQFYRLQGIRVVVKDHINIHSWLDRTSPQFIPAFHEAVFHYSPRRSKDERLEICISTPDMRAAAWRYAHHSQVIVDGTFGVCNKKVLLFIVMGVDEQNRGVPLAFLLFSAPSNNQQTSAGYNTEVLERLLGAWQQSMGSRNGEDFEPWVAITDTDLAERAALLHVFPSIWLLICRFHLRQSWKNHRNSCICGARGSRTVSELRARAKRLEDTLVETEEFSAAKELIREERDVLLAMQLAIADDQTSDAEADLGVIAGALEHLRYLDEYWCREWLWASWSRRSRLTAAVRLQRPVNEVLPTTNHIESFNGVLKNHYLAREKKGGQRLRMDILVHILVFKVWVHFHSLLPCSTLIHRGRYFPRYSYNALSKTAQHYVASRPSCRYRGAQNFFVPMQQRQQRSARSRTCPLTPSATPRHACSSVTNRSEPPLPTLQRKFSHFHACHRYPHHLIRLPSRMTSP